MAGRNNRTPGTRQRSGKDRRSTAFKTAMSLQSAEGMTRQPGQTTADILQEVLDRAVAWMRLAAEKVDQLDLDAMEGKENPDGFWRNTIAGEMPSKWYQMEKDSRREVHKLAEAMAKLGIADRQIKVQEAQTALIGRALKEAMEIAGISVKDQREVGKALRTILEQAEANLDHAVPA